MSENTIIKNNSVWVYFIVVFVISWILWIPIIIFQDTQIMKDFGQIIFFIGIMVPSFAGIVLTFIFEGSEETKIVLKRGIKLFSLFWLLFIIFLIPVIIALSLSITGLLTDTMELITNMPKGMIAFISFPFILLIGGPLFEEFGWRGFALDRLQSKWNSVIASLILGLFWGLWHLPAFFIVGTSQNILLEYIPIVAVLFFIQIILVTIIITLVYNSTEKSILSVLLFHTMWNTTFGGFFMSILTNFVDDPTTIASNNAIINTINLANIVLTLLLILVCFIIVIKWGMNLGRKETS